MKTVSKLFLYVAMALCAATMYSCKDDDDKTTVYTVTFDADGGSPVPATQSVEAGGTATAPATPVKSGYVFLFWHLSGVNTAYNFSAPITGDVALHAKWQEEVAAEYWQVAWELNGGAWSASDQATQVVKGGTLAEPTAPVKAGYSFEGWYKEAAFSNKIAFPYDVSAVTGNFTLYAKWTTGSSEEQGTSTVASGHYYYLILHDDGSLYTLGHNKYGQLGTGDEKDVENLTQVATGVAAVYSGGINTFIVKTNGNVLGTGYNGDGELGLGDETWRAAFTAIPVDNIKTIAPSSGHTLLLKNNGSLWATGWNAYGFLGVGDNTKRNVFTATNLTSDVIAIAAGTEHSLALKKDGTVWGAGYGYVGALGADATDAEVSSFVQIFSGAKGIAAGSHYSLILADDGTVYVSGVNYYGQLGVGTTDDVTAFTQAIESSGTPLSNVTAIATGYHFSLALKADGSLWATGHNHCGQLATGDEDDRSKFTKVATGVKSMSAGRFHSIIVKNDGTTSLFGEVNPFANLNGSGTIHIKVNDTYQYQTVSNAILYDRSLTEIFNNNGQVAVTGGNGTKISVKPGTYNLKLYTSNSAPYTFSDLVVGDNETVTILYEWVSTVGYRWTVTRSK